MSLQLLPRLLSTRGLMAAAALAFAFGGTAQAQVVFDDFDNADPTTYDVFSGGGAGIGVGPTNGVDGVDDTALSVGINPTTGGGFAGFVIPGPAGTTDISGANYLTFSLRPLTTVDVGPVTTANQPLTMEIFLQEDANGNGTFDGATDDEYRTTVNVPVGMDYIDIEIPIYAFGNYDNNNAGANDGLDLTKILQVVVAFGNLQGPEFGFSIDNLAFVTASTTAGQPLPQSFDSALSVYPNPASGAATFTFGLSEASDVTVDVVDLLGRTVATLATGQQAAGTVRLDIPTSTLAGGLYLVRVQTETGVASTRFTVVR